MDILSNGYTIKNKDTILYYTLIYFYGGYEIPVHY